MYPDGQAEAGVTAQVVAKTAISSPTILIVRMTASFAAMPVFVGIVHGSISDALLAGAAEPGV
jgi:hypothetical protein